MRGRLELHWRRRGKIASVGAMVAVGAVAATLLPACGREEAPDLSNGKALFSEKCGSCHVLKRAGTAGKVGPDLDAAFGPARRDGLGQATVEGVVADQIANVRKGSQMPEDLVTGQDARDVAAYVAMVAGMPGEDRGQLAEAGLAGATEGRQIFTAAGCNACHTLADAGSSSNVGPSLDELKDVAGKRRPGMSAAGYVEEAIVKPDDFIVSGFQAGVMPGNYGERLDPKQVDALVEYLLGRGE